jgi:hypothetical protein
MIKRFVIQRKDLGDGVIPLARYLVSSINHKLTIKSMKNMSIVAEPEVINAAGSTYLRDAVGVALDHARKGCSSSDIKRVEITIQIDKEGSKHGKS